MLRVAVVVSRKRVLHVTKAPAMPKLRGAATTMANPPCHLPVPASSLVDVGIVSWGPTASSKRAFFTRKGKRSKILSSPSPVTVPPSPSGAVTIGNV